MRFIAFEGLDGSGKSTLIEGLKSELNRQGVQCRVTREPGGSPLGDELRQILLRLHGDTPAPRTELLLYQAIRAQHVEKLIRPTLQEGSWVLSDRYAASSVAFQSGGREISTTDVEKLNEFSTGGLQPDLYVLLDVSVEESLRRRQGREVRTGQSMDRFEREKQDFHQRVREAYLALAKKDSARWLVISSQQKPAEVLQQLLSELKRRQWLKN